MLAAIRQGSRSFRCSLPYRPRSSRPTRARVKEFQDRAEESELLMKLYVGNLSFKTTEDQLRAAFEQFGAVSSASLVLDRETGRPRGFGFVEMPDD